MASTSKYKKIGRGKVAAKKAQLQIGALGKGIEDIKLQTEEDIEYITGATASAAQLWEIGKSVVDTSRFKSEVAGIVEKQSSLSYGDRPKFLGMEYGDRPIQHTTYDPKTGEESIVGMSAAEAHLKHTYYPDLLERNTARPEISPSPVTTQIVNVGDEDTEMQAGETITAGEDDPYGIKEGGEYTITPGFPERESNEVPETVMDSLKNGDQGVDGLSPATFDKSAELGRFSRAVLKAEGGPDYNYGFKKEDIAGLSKAEIEKKFITTAIERGARWEERSGQELFIDGKYNPEFIEAFGRNWAPTIEGEVSPVWGIDTSGLSQRRTATTSVTGYRGKIAGLGETKTLSKAEHELNPNWLKNVFSEMGYGEYKPSTLSRHELYSGSYK